MRVRVRSADAALPLDGVVVYLLPKTGESGREPTRVATPDQEGVAVLDEVDPRRHWVGAFTGGHVPAFADGDSWRGGEVDLVLEPGRVIEVEVRHAGGPLPPDTCIVAKPSGTRGEEYPAPNEQVHFWNRVGVEQAGIQVLRVPTDMRVAVSIHAPGLYAEQASVDVPPDTSRVLFELHPVCRIRVGVTDAETGQDLAYDADVEVRDTGPGGATRTIRASLFCRAADWKERGLQPGEYTVSIRASGYVPWPITRVRFEHPGQEVTIQAPLALAPDAGRLILNLDLPGGEVLGEALIHVEQRPIRNGAKDVGDWSALQVRTVDRRVSSITLWPLEAGPHDLIVWAGSHLVGRVKAQVQGGRLDHARVRLGPGVVVDFSKCPLGPSSEEVVAEGEAPGAVEWFVDVLDANGLAFPEIRWASRQPPDPRENALEQDAVERRGEINRATVLGPFPAERVRVQDGLSKEEPAWVVRR